MKPRPIGIVGGAGPLAGALLLERVLNLSGSIYGCCKDADFPEVFLLSFPFSEMLSPKIDVKQIKKELYGCLKKLRKNGAAVLTISCNTLHAFLDDDDDLSDLVHLPKALAAKIPSGEIPLVLCTTTSMKFGVHKQFFPCIYPDPKTQLQIDLIIEQILKGADRQMILKKLIGILETETASTIILGCTELSLFTGQLSSVAKLIIDPLEITAGKVLEKSFLKDRSLSC